MSFFFIPLALISFKFLWNNFGCFSAINSVLIFLYFSCLWSWYETITKKVFSLDWSNLRRFPQTRAYLTDFYCTSLKLPSYFIPNTLLFCKSPHIPSKTLPHENLPHLHLPWHSPHKPTPSTPPHKELKTFNFIHNFHISPSSTERRTSSPASQVFFPSFRNISRGRELFLITFAFIANFFLFNFSWIFFFFPTRKSIRDMRR
jgi:hypothetical protein